MVYSMVNVPESHYSCRWDSFDWENKKLLRGYLESFVKGNRKGITFIGKPGVGKTHLMVATYLELQKTGKLPGSQVIFWDWMDLLKYLRQGFDHKIRADVTVPKMCEVEYLLIDDVKPESTGSFWQQMLELVIESAYNSTTKIILSTNADDNEELITRWNLSDYHVSRLGSLTDIIVLKGKDKRVE